MTIVNHAHCYGLRDAKYSFLLSHNISNTRWNIVNPQPPFHLLIPQDTTLWGEYEKGWKITEIMPVNSVGIVTARDKFSIHWTKQEIWKTVDDFSRLDSEVARSKYSLGEDVQDWKVESAQADLNSTGPSEDYLTPIFYRPFDIRYTYYTGKSRGFHCRTRFEVMRHLLPGNNLALITSRLTKGESFQHCQVTENIVEVICMSPKTSNNGFVFPLYCLPTTEGERRMNIGARPNFSEAFLNEFKSCLGFDPKPYEIFAYIYSILHSPMYRSRYSEFLKMDFAKIPLTRDSGVFKKLSSYGNELIQIHLMKSDKAKIKVNDFAEKSDRTVDPGHPKYANGKVSINKRGDGFTGVPQEVWEFYVGGYQVCHKWLKDRKGRTLSDDDILHYQKIIVALQETIRIMQQIDDAIPSWPIE